MFAMPIVYLQGCNILYYILLYIRHGAHRVPAGIQHTILYIIICSPWCPSCTCRDATYYIIYYYIFAMVPIVYLQCGMQHRTWRLRWRRSRRVIGRAPCGRRHATWQCSPSAAQRFKSRRSTPADAGDAKRCNVDATWMPRGCNVDATWPCTATSIAFSAN